MDINQWKRLPQMMRAFLTSLQDKGRKRSTLQRYAYDLEDLHKWLEAQELESGHQGFRQLTPSHAARWLHDMQVERQYSTATIKRMLTVIQQFYKFLAEEGQERVSNPFLAIDLSEFKSKPLGLEAILSYDECHRFYDTVLSDEGYSEQQMKARPYLKRRNYTIIRLLLHYGLTTAEVTALTIKDIFFEQNTIKIEPVHTASQARTVQLEKNDRVELFHYLMDVPEPVRPRYYTDDPFFVAFDFQRLTFRWVYETDCPKALSDFAVQKMIRQEAQRAGRSGYTAQQMRHTCIIHTIASGDKMDEHELQQRFGFHTPLSARRYLRFFQQHQAEIMSRVQPTIE
ncbi:site-specific integrase [Bacillaceae bacterium SIJ1]|uniref:tyrosine-type recombinase/integrase n=1 Tax=Litoribacterium kuwaitense TaxID=1398745 RepID=UPI0013E9EB03|nr:site-specific integrase [Litoribacterium kuwaitense]NGP44053.1 site-specific integrase [Litoribacterium kuwaitense]